MTTNEQTQLDLVDLLAAIQHTYFDLVDAKDGALLAFRRGADKPQEFDNVKEWVEEQIGRLGDAESIVTDLCRQHGVEIPE
jgi:hypothetical protein